MIRRLREAAENDELGPAWWAWPIRVILWLFVLAYMGPSILLAAAIYIGGWLLMLAVPILIVLYVFGEVL